VALADVGVDQSPRLGKDHPRDLRGEHVAGPGVQLLGKFAGLTLDADVHQIRDVPAAVLDGQPLGHGTDYLAHRDVTAAQPVGEERSRRIPGDQRPVEVEERPDLRAFGRAVDLLQEPFDVSHVSLPLRPWGPP
jgi:hypothetical protein